MATQLFQFQPTATPHYTLAETWKEKDAAMQRRIAEINAQNAGEMAQAAMQGDYNMANRNADRALDETRMGALQQQQNIDNGMAQQKLDADVSTQQQAQARLGVQDARNAANDRRDIEQQAFQNNRIQAQDARAAVENQQKDKEFSDQQVLAAKQQLYAGLGEGFLTNQPDKNGDVDFTSHRDVLEQGLADKLPSDTRIVARPNPETKNYDFYAAGQDGGYAPLVKHGVPLSLSPNVVDMSKTVAKKVLGIGKEKGQDLQVIYRDDVDANGVTHRTPVDVFDKNSGDITHYAGAANAAPAPAPGKDLSGNTMGEGQTRLMQIKQKVDAEQQQQNAPQEQPQPAPVVSNLAPRPLVTYAPNGDESQAPHNPNLIPNLVPKHTPMPSQGPRRALVPRGTSGSWE